MKIHCSLAFFCITSNDSSITKLVNILGLSKFLRNNCPDKIRTLHCFAASHTNILINTTCIAGNVRHVNGRDAALIISHRCHGKNKIARALRFYKGKFSSYSALLSSSIYSKYSRLISICLSKGKVLSSFQIAVQSIGYKGLPS